MPTVAENPAPLPTAALTERAWFDLVRSVQKGRCALVLGPSLACDAVGAPLRRLLANRIADEIQAEHLERAPDQPGPALPGRDDLAQMCSEYLRRDDVSVAYFNEKILGAFYRDRQPGLLLRELAAMPFRTIINTTPDLLMLEAMKKAGRNPAFGHYNISGAQEKLIVEAGQPLLYNLFGKIGDDKSLVLSQEHQMNFIDRALTSDAGIPVSIKNLLTNEIDSYIFLGFDFENWYFRVLFHLLKLNPKAQNIIGIHFDGPKTLAPPMLTTAFFKLQFRFKFLEMPPEAFISELQSRLKSAETASENSEIRAPKSEIEQTAARSILVLSDEADSAYRNELLSQVARRAEILGFQILEPLAAGAEVAAESRAAVDAAEVILPLISASFFNEELAAELLDRALARRKMGALVCPILIRPYEWERAEAERDFCKPANLLPVKSWPDSDPKMPWKNDAAWQSVAADLLSLLESR